MTTTAPNATESPTSPATGATGSDRTTEADAPRIDVRASDFSALASTACGVRVIRISGVAICPGPGWELSLSVANPGVVPHPASLWLVLHATPPRDAASPRRARVAVEVETIIEDSAAQEIVVRSAFRDPMRVPVVEATQVGRAPMPRRRGGRSVG